VVRIDRIMSEGRALTNAIGNSTAVMVTPSGRASSTRSSSSGRCGRPQQVERATDQALGTTIEPTQRFRRTESPADSREPAPASSS
jgi:hypothetical protein